MCETCKLPAASLRARNRHPSSYPQSQRAPRDDAKLAVRRIRRNPTESDRIRQDDTKTRARPRARARGNGVPFPYPEEAAAMCETCKPPVASLRAPNRHPSLYPQSQRAPRDDAKLTVRRIRQNSTEYDRMRQNATKTRARTRARQRRSVFPFPRHGLRPGRSGFDVSHRSELPPPCRHANRPNRTPFSQLVACNSHVCYYFPSIGERRQT